MSRRKAPSAAASAAGTSAVAGASAAARPPRARNAARAVRSAVAVVAAAALAAVLLAGCSGWGAAAKSVLDRMVPGPSVTMWAASPDPDGFTDSYADATGAGANYVYLVDAVAQTGAHRQVTIISFGGKSKGSGYLEIEVRGTSGIHYDAASEDDVPAAVRAELDEAEGC